MVVISVLFIGVFGLKLGIEFKGGALTEITYKNSRPIQTELEPLLKPLGFGSLLLQPTGELGYIIKSRDLDNAEHALLLKTLSLGENTATEVSFNSIGPSVGSELARKSIFSIIFVVIAIIIFITFAFRKVSQPVKSWKYGVITVITLLHDIIIPAGIFAFISHYTGAEVETLFVLALLTILGLSVHDKIVVFDRIRENLRAGTKQTFAETVGRSTSQTIVRSINITLTIIFVLVPLYLFGPATTKDFALILTIGLFFGIYSSLFFASPLLVLVEEWQKKKK
jgi:preprotein translocase subunit SecF